MADYHPLIARAVTGLDKNTGENRRALYERARVALVAQLRGVVPALEESEITRERLALEEAIRKVEAEAARQAREIARPKPARRTELPKREDPPRREEPARREEPPRPPPRTSRIQTENPSRPAASPPIAEPASPPLPPPPFPPIGPRRSLQDEALKRFRETPPALPEQRPLRSSRPIEPPQDDLLPDSMLPPGPTEPWPRERHSIEEFSQFEPQFPRPPENLWPLPLDNTQTRPAMDLDVRHPPPPPPPEQQPPEPQQHDAPRYEPDEPETRPAPRSYGRMIRAGLVLTLLLVFGSLLWWQRSTITDAALYVVALFQPSAPPPREVAAPARPKIADRIGQPQPSTGPAVAQRVVLYEEEPDDPQGKRFVGTVLWRTEMRPATPGRPPELAVRGDVDVPERQMKVTLSFRRNTDASLPASHTIEIVFTVPGDSSSGGVQKVPGVLMKQAEQTRGVPLAGLAVPVTPGYFLIGLSSLESDMQRNIQLLKERSWFDIPIIYNNNRRAILALEKGTPGEQAFSQAFAAWKQ